MKLIQSVTALLAFLAAGCVTTGGESTADLDLNTILRDPIEEGKARRIILSYLLDATPLRAGSHDFQLHRCDASTVDGCFSDPFYAEQFGALCDCDYLLYQNPNACYLAVRVVETCDDGPACRYEFDP